MSDAALFKTSTLTEMVDALVLPAPGRKPLFVLAGYGDALRANYSLAEPVDFDVRVRIAKGTREYDLDALDFRVFPKAGTVPVDLCMAHLYRVNSELHDYFRVYLIAREEKFLAEFESQLTALAFETATTAKEWRLENALDWCVSERRAESRELQPETGIKMPDKLRWRLRRPIFRADEHRVLYQWELCSLIDGPYERPLITCVTDNEGVVARAADLLPIRLMFAKLAAPSAPSQPIAQPAGAPQAQPPAVAPQPQAAPQAPGKPGAAPEPRKIPIAKPPEKVVPAYRKQALEDRMRAAGEAEMAKIRKLFEMPD